MLRGIVSFSIMAAALVPAPPASAEPAETLARSGNWIVDYDEDACHLVAEFGTGKDKVIMRITRHDLGDAFKISFYGGRFGTLEVLDRAKLDFGLSRAPIEAGAISGRVGDLKAIFLSGIRLDGWKADSPAEIGPAITREQEASVSGVTVRFSYKKPFRLEFGSLRRPFAQLRSCQADLVKSWGYDPEVQLALSRRPQSVANAGVWLKSSDYPAHAATKGYNGLVEIRLDVDEAGRVAGCHVLNRTNPDLFADLTCQAVTKRAQLEPALDASGRPVRSFLVRSIVWMVGK